MAYAINADQYEICEFLLENGADVNITVNSPYNDNLLFMMLKKPKGWNYNKIFELLIKNGCNIEHKNTNKSTLLMYAASCKDYVSCEILLKYGANVNEQNELGFTVLHMLCNFTSPYRAIDKGIYSLYKFCVLFVEYGADVLLKDIYGKIPSEYCNHYSGNNGFMIHEYLKQREHERELLNQNFKRAQDDEADSDQEFNE